MSTKALAYLRVSGLSQVAGDGLSRQRKVIRDYARRNGIEVLEEFVDPGVSGTTRFEDRPGLMSMIDRIAGNGVRMVLVERADRLSRDLIAGELLVEKFQELEVEVILAESGTKFAKDDSPTAVLIRQILASVAEFEKSSIVEKLRKARKRKKAAGTMTEGRKPFGFRPGEKQTLARMLELRKKPRGRARKGFLAIAKQLDSEGLSTRSSKPWTAESVRRIIQRERPDLG